jgi:hypothetical protein
MPENYAIRVADRLGPVLRGAFAGLRAHTVPRHTVIEGWLSDEELRALLVRMEHIGGQLVHLHRVAGDLGRRST